MSARSRSVQAHAALLQSIDSALADVVHRPLTPPRRDAQPYTGWSAGRPDPEPYRRSPSPAPEARYYEGVAGVARDQDGSSRRYHDGAGDAARELEGSGRHMEINITRTPGGYRSASGDRTAGTSAYAGSARQWTDRPTEDVARSRRLFAAGDHQESYGVVHEVHRRHQQDIDREADLEHQRMAARDRDLQRERERQAERERSERDRQAELDRQERERQLEQDRLDRERHLQERKERLERKQRGARVLGALGSRVRHGRMWAGFLSLQRHRVREWRRVTALQARVMVRPLLVQRVTLLSIVLVTWVRRRKAMLLQGVFRQLRVSALRDILAQDRELMTSKLTETRNQRHQLLDEARLVDESLADLGSARADQQRLAEVVGNMHRYHAGADAVRQVALNRCRRFFQVQRRLTAAWSVHGSLSALHLAAVLRRVHRNWRASSMFSAVTKWRDVVEFCRVRQALDESLALANRPAASLAAMTELMSPEAVLVTKRSYAVAGSVGLQALEEAPRARSGTSRFVPRWGMDQPEWYQTILEHVRDGGRVEDYSA